MPLTISQKNIMEVTIRGKKGGFLFKKKLLKYISVCSTGDCGIYPTFFLLSTRVESVWYMGAAVTIILLWRHGHEHVK